MRTSAATLHSWRHEFGSFGIVKKCVRGGGGTADLPRTLTFTYMAGNNIRWPYSPLFVRHVLYPPLFPPSFVGFVN